MPTISLTLPTSATVITAGLHSTNYTSIQNLVNGGLDNNNVSTTAGIDGTKLATNVARIYDRVTTGVDVQNTLTATSVYTKSVSGNDMGTNRMLRLTMLGDYLHNNVAGDALSVRIKFGGTTFCDATTTLGGVTGAGRQPWRLNALIANLGASNSQMIEAALSTLSANGGAPTSGIGNFGVGGSFTFGELGISTLGTIDTTAAQTLDASVQWSAASANNSFRMRYSILELV